MFLCSWLMNAFLCSGLLDNGHAQADDNMTNRDEVAVNNQMADEGDFMNNHLVFAFNWAFLAYLGWIHVLSISTISTSVQILN